MKKLLLVTALLAVMMCALTALADVGSSYPTTLCPVCGTRTATFLDDNHYDCVYGGYLGYDCDNCGWVYVPHPAIGFHDYGEYDYTGCYMRDGEFMEPATCGQQAMKIRTCRYCNIGDVGYYIITHTEQEGSRHTVRAASCQLEGLEEWTCSICGQTFQDMTDTTGHKQAEGTYSIRIQPTCGEKGSAQYICEYCGQTIIIDADPVGEHSYGAWDTDIAPTCTKPGTEVRMCGVCGTSEIRVAEALGHSISTEPIMVKPYTDWSYGLRAVGCERCGYHTGKEEVVYPPHTSFKGYDGNEKSTVKHLQEMLKQLHYYDGSVDGDFGVKTANAVKYYQQSVGVKSDSIAWPGLLKLLEDDTAKRHITVTGDDCFGLEKTYHKAGDVINIAVTIKNDGDAVLESATVTVRTSHRKNPRGGWLTDYTDYCETYTYDYPLQPGESATITGITYTIDKYDVENGFVTLAYVPAGIYYRHDDIIRNTTSGGNWHVYPCTTIDTKSIHRAPEINVMPVAPKQNEYNLNAPVDFVVSVKNTSNVTMERFAITVKAVNIVGIVLFRSTEEYMSILPGETVKYYFTWQMTKTPYDYGYTQNGNDWMLKYECHYRWRKTNGKGGFEFAAEQRDRVVDTYTINTAKPYSYFPDVDVDIIRATPYEMEKNGFVEYNIKITNKSKDEVYVKNLRLLATYEEDNTGAYPYNSGFTVDLAPGESHIFIARINVGAETGLHHYNFFTIFDYEYKLERLEKIKDIYVNYEFKGAYKTVKSSGSTPNIRCEVDVR